jgi:hypothetical protein
LIEDEKARKREREMVNRKGSVKIAADHADRTAMRSTTETFESRQAIDRRHGSDRRTDWRGGRRDADWINRPPGVLALLTQATISTKSTTSSPSRTLAWWRRLSIN